MESEDYKRLQKKVKQLIDNKIDMGKEIQAHLDYGDGWQAVNQDGKYYITFQGSNYLGYSSFNIDKFIELLK